METFVDAVVRALPEAVATAITTILLTGGILFLFQKKIDDLFVRKMEQFRARLQYESFEHQQRFSAMYPRRLETLETLYKKFFDYSEAFSEWTNGVAGDAITLKDDTIVAAKVDPENHATTKANSDAKLRDFLQYYQKNCIFLPPTVIQQLETIWSDTLVANALVELTIRDPETDLTGMLFDEVVFKEQVNRTGSVYAAAGEARGEVIRQVAALEKLYKLAAESK